MPQLTVAQRERLPQWSLKHNGWGDGSGYPGKANNPACRYVHHGLEYSCCDGYTASAGHAGLPLLGGMQPGMAEGAAYVPDLYEFGKRRGGIRHSWECEVGDAWLVNTGAGAQPGHIECVYDIVGIDANTLDVYTVGWDSGPSNVDHYRGQGGVHRHVWRVVKGQGNPACYATVNADVLVDFARVTDTPRKRRHRSPKPPHVVKTHESRVSETPTPTPDPQRRPQVVKVRHAVHGLLAYLATLVPLLTGTKVGDDKSLLLSIAPAVIVAVAGAVGDKITPKQAAVDATMLADVLSRLQAPRTPPTNT
jgi:hypothetical protein